MPRRISHKVTKNTQKLCDLCVVCGQNVVPSVASADGVRPESLEPPLEAPLGETVAPPPPPEDPDDDEEDPDDEDEEDPDDEDPESDPEDPRLKPFSRSACSCSALCHAARCACSPGR